MLIMINITLKIAKNKFHKYELYMKLPFIVTVQRLAGHEKTDGVD